LERNPVCFPDFIGKSAGEAFSIIENLENKSIYDDKRLALPDEVWNYKRGDGIEKAILLADVILHNDNLGEVKILIDDNKVLLEYGKEKYSFNSAKGLKRTISVKVKEYKII
jgi:hypothetical protein